MTHIMTAKSFSLNQKSGNYYYTAQAAGVPLGNIVNWDALYTAWIASVRSNTATTYYVNYTTGNDTTGAGTSGNPWKTIRKALNTVAGGSEVIVQGTGTITNDKLMFISENSGHATAIPSGASATARTIIRAENPLELTIAYNANDLTFFDSMVYLNNAQYVLIDGFKFDLIGENQDPGDMANILSQRNALTRCFFRKNTNTSYGGWINAPAYYTLVQDCAGVGTCRYGFSFGSGGSGAAGKNVARRVVGRCDYWSSNQPKAVFSHYGNNGSGTLSGETEFQNAIAIDTVYAFPDGTYGDPWGGWYCPKNAQDIRLRGCMSLNNSAHAGFWCTDQFSATHSIIEDCVAYGDNGTFTPGTTSQTGGQPWDSSHMRGFHCNNNGIYRRLTALGMTGTKFEGGMVPTASNSTIAVANLMHDANGADVRFCYGEFGTTYGETGYNTLTSVPLWAYPYEDKIREWFRGAATVVPATYYPTTVDVNRGFCADGKTLTRYIAGLTGTDPDIALANLYST